MKDIIDDLDEMTKLDRFLETWRVVAIGILVTWGVLNELIHVYVAIVMIGASTYILLRGETRVTEKKPEVKHLFKERESK